MIYNPFMPSVRFSDRAVFGGGGGDPNPLDIDPMIAINKKTAADKLAAEQQAASVKAGGSATEYASGILGDVDAAAKAAQAESDRLNLEMSSLRSQLAQGPKEGEDGYNPQIQVSIDAKQKELDEAIRKAADVGQVQAGELRAGQRDMVTKSVTDPLALVEQSKVSKIDPNTTGAIIGTGVTRDYKQVDAEAAGFVAPPNNVLVTQAVETFYNPTTGETATVMTGGYTAPKGWIKGQPTGTFTEPKAGQISGTAPTATATTATATTADTPTNITASTYEATTAADEVDEATKDLIPEQGVITDDSTVTAATMKPTDTAVGDLTAAQGESIVLNNPVTREIEAGEIISGAADAERAAAFTEQVQAATATPTEKATVQGQLTDLMQDFEGGDTPAWAAGSMRAANAAMIARGIGSSSMAGQAIIQATMEAALPIAMADAQTQASFEAQNLSNRQARAMLAAEQRAKFMGQEFDQAFQARVQNAGRIADVANMNFTAEQSIALENSRTANTMALSNLNNKQAMVLAHAASISQLESQNLSNQQQAAVQNAQNFLQMDMANLTNAQQTSMFKAQSNIQALFTDQAADNAAKQFNASSENQTKQFMANLNSQVNQFNVSQANAMEQFNAGEENVLSKFNASMKEQRNQFNAQNGLVVAQANAQWRQNVTTLNNAAQNESNMVAAATANQMTQATMDQIWQRERDLMDFAFKASESEKDRHVNILIADKKIEEYQAARDDEESTYKWATAIDIIFS